MRWPVKNLEIRNRLIQVLIDEKAFWSYDMPSSKIEDISDDYLIALTLKYLDLEEIELLKKIYSLSRIKKAWMRLMVPEGQYLYNLNRFIAWYYFGIKDPSRYLKSMQTRLLNRKLNVKTI